MILIIILITIYLLSAFGFWKYLNVAHSKNGRYEGVQLYFSDIFFTFFPLINTALSIGLWICFPPKGPKQLIYNKFFKIKK